MTIGDVLIQCGNVKYICIHHPEFGTKYMEINEIDEKEKGIEFNTFSVSIYMGKVCLEFDV